MVMRALTRALVVSPNVRIRGARCCNPHCAAQTFRRAFRAETGHEQAIADTFNITDTDSNNNIIIPQTTIHEFVSPVVSSLRFAREATVAKSPIQLWRLIQNHYDPQKRLNVSELKIALRVLRTLISEKKFPANVYEHDSHSALYRALVAALPGLSLEQLVSVTGSLSAVHDEFAANRIRLHDSARQSLDSAVAALVAHWSTEQLRAAKNENHSITALFLSFAHFTSLQRDNQHLWLLRRSLMEMIEGAVPTLSLKGLSDVLGSLVNINSFDTNTDVNTVQQHELLCHQLFVTIMDKVLSEPALLVHCASHQLVSLAQSVARFSPLSRHYHDDVVSRLCEQMLVRFDTVRLVDAHRFAMALVAMKYDSPLIYRLVIGKWLAAPLSTWTQDSKVANLLTGLLALYPWQNDTVMMDFVNLFQANFPLPQIAMVRRQRVHLLWALLAYTRANPSALVTLKWMIEAFCQSLNSAKRWSTSEAPDLTVLYRCLLLAPWPLPLHSDLVSRATTMWRRTRERECKRIQRTRDYQKFLHYYQQNMSDQRWNLEQSFTDSDTRLAPLNTVGVRRDGSGFLLWPYPRDSFLHINESRTTLVYQVRLQLQLARDAGKELYVIKKKFVRGQLEWRLVAVREGESETAWLSDARAVE